MPRIEPQVRAHVSICSSHTMACEQSTKQGCCRAPHATIDIDYPSVALEDEFSSTVLEHSDAVWPGSPQR